MEKNSAILRRIQERDRAAWQAEQDGDLDTAIELYEQNIKENYPGEYAFERLMILYRKQKDYEEELRVINHGINVFAQELEDHLKHSFSKNVDRKKVEDLSDGIMNNNGFQLMYYANPLDKWAKRKEFLEKKLKE